MAELIIRSGKHQGKKLVLPAVRVLIGRDRGCQIRLASNDVSRKHCSLRVSPEGIFARDLGSRNGTLVNDVPIKHEALLKPGDLLRVGPMLFQVPKKKDVPATQPGSSSEAVPAEAATDDDIIAWLSDEESNGVFDPGETTIISHKAKDTEQEKEKAKKTAASPKSTTRRQFKSIADEAADIIRRHWEMVHKQQGNPKRQQQESQSGQ